MKKQIRGNPSNSKKKKNKPKILQEWTITDQRCPKKKYNNWHMQENQFYFQKQCWNSDLSDSKEEFQHTNFAPALFSQ